MLTAALWARKEDKWCATFGWSDCGGDIFTFFNHQCVIVEVIRLPAAGIITANEWERGDDDWNPHVGDSEFVFSDLSPHEAYCFSVHARESELNF